MIKFLLVFILFSPVEGRYKDVVSVFKTAPECEAALATVREAVIPEPGIVFVLACLPTKPTDGTDI